MHLENYTLISKKQNLKKKLLFYCADVKEWDEKKIYTILGFFFFFFWKQVYCACYWGPNPNESTGIMSQYINWNMASKVQNYKLKHTKHSYFLILTVEKATKKVEICRKQPEEAQTMNLNTLRGKLIKWNSCGWLQTQTWRDVLAVGRTGTKCKATPRKNEISKTWVKKKLRKEK